MPQPRTWQEELKLVVDMMRDLSREDDPQKAAIFYGTRLKQTGLLPIDERLSVSRRNLKAPYYRITRSSRWTEEIDPWKQPDRLPMHSTGLLGELVYSDEPAVFTDLPDRLKKDDPAYDELQGFQMLISTPFFEEGEAINLIVGLIRDPATFPLTQIPMMVWLSNLWGRGVLNLVLRRELQASHEKLKAANKDLDRELGIVGEIQKSLLPARLPNIPGMQLAAHYKTSERAGGDYYDIFDCGDGCWGILIADVSGHGAPAAVIMAITHAIAHLHPGRGTPPGELLNFVNKTLATHYTNGNGSFVTAFYGLYDVATKSLTFARAGHNSPRLLRNGQIQSMDGKGGVPLGLFPDSHYGEATEILKPADLLMLYTDGIVEARSRDGELLTVERLDATLVEGPLEAQPALDRILTTLETFTGGATPLDDQTLLAAAIK